MSPDRKETPFERRIRELEEEASRLQRNIKTINKAIDRGDLEQLQSLRPARVEAPRLPPTPPAARPSAEPAAAAAAPTTAAAAAPASVAPPHAPPPTATADEGSAWRAMPRAPQRPQLARGNERFASYLSSGSFGKSRPVGVERRVLRNKAVFALLLALILSFILYKLLS